MLFGACTPAVPTDAQYDVVTDRPHALALEREMTGVGCLMIPAGERAKTRLVVGIALPSGDLRHFDCGAVAHDSVQVAMNRYTAGALTRRTTTASMSETEWWELDFPLILEPPSEGGDWLFIDKEQGWGQIPPWTLEYYCEAAVGGGYYMIKCWEWIPSEGGGGDPPEEPPSSPPHFILTCNQSNDSVLTISHGAEVSCTALPSSGSITSISWEYAGPGHYLGSGNWSGSPHTLSGPVVYSGTAYVSGMINDSSAGDASVRISIPDRTFSWGTPDTTGTASSSCSGFTWRDGINGYTALRGGCPVGFQPLVGSGVSTQKVATGLNKGIWYATGVDFHIEAASYINPESTGYGEAFWMEWQTTVRPGADFDSLSAHSCYSAFQNVQILAISTCMGTGGVVQDFAAKVNAHEGCHKAQWVSFSLESQYTNMLNILAKKVEMTDFAAEQSAALRANVGYQVATRSADALHTAAGRDPFYFWSVAPRTDGDYWALHLLTEKSC